MMVAGVGDLLERFSELEIQLGELTAAVRQSVPQISSVASSSKCLLNTLEQEQMELKK